MEMLKKVKMLKKVRKQFLDLTRYLDLHQNLMESFLGRDPSSIQMLCSVVFV